MAQNDSPTARDQMVMAAAQLLRRQGYAATGLQQVIEESGSPKGSLYYYFPGGKEDLATEAIRFGGRTMSAGMRAAFDSAETLADGFEQLAELLATNLESSEFLDGCFIATTTLEMASRSQSLCEASAETFSIWQDRIARRLRDEGHRPQAAEKLATLVISSLEGALVLARALRDGQPVRDVAKSLRPSLAPPARRSHP